MALHIGIYRDFLVISRIQRQSLYGTNPTSVSLLIILIWCGVQYEGFDFLLPDCLKALKQYTGPINIILSMLPKTAVTTARPVHQMKTAIRARLPTISAAATIRAPIILIGNLRMLMMQPMTSRMVKLKCSGRKSLRVRLSDEVLL